MVALGGDLYVYGGVRVMRDGADTILSDVLVARAQGGVVNQPWKRLAIGESAPSQPFRPHAQENSEASVHDTGHDPVAEDGAATCSAVQGSLRDCLQGACRLLAWRPVSSAMKAQRDASAFYSLEACESRLAPPKSEAAPSFEMPQRNALLASACDPVTELALHETPPEEPSMLTKDFCPCCFWVSQPRISISQESPLGVTALLQLGK